jgi:hypothetical protein
MSSTSNINPKPCNYGCNTRIYWDVNQNAYFEYSVRITIYVQTYLKIIINLLFQQQHQQQLVILNPHIIAKNPGIDNPNQRCLIPLNI